MRHGRLPTPPGWTRSPTFQYNRADNDELIVNDLVPVDATQMSDTELEQLKLIALNDPLLRNRLISLKAHVTGVNVVVQLPGG